MCLVNSCAEDMNHSFACGLAKVNKPLVGHVSQQDTSSVLEFKLPERPVGPQECEIHVGSKGPMEMAMRCKLARKGRILPDVVARHSEKRAA